MGGAAVSIWISVLSFSMFQALTFRLDSICTLGLLLYRQNGQGGALVTHPPWAHGGRFVGDTGEAICTGDLVAAPRRILSLSAL